MSAIVSFEFALLPGSMGALSRALADFVVPEPGDAGATASVLSRLEALVNGTVREDCFMFRFQVDAAIKAYCTEQDDPVLDGGAEIPLGCFWASHFQDATTSALSFTGATSSLGALMRESRSVQSRFEHAARAAGLSLWLVGDDGTRCLLAAAAA